MIEARKVKMMVLIIDSDGKHIYVPTEDVDAATHIRFYTPGPFYTRMIPVSPSHSPSWSWNKSVTHPTLSPSLLTTTSMLVDGTIKDVRCHSFIKNGMIQFLKDCTHEFAGQVLPLFTLSESGEPLRG